MIPLVIQAGVTASWSVAEPREYSGHSFEYILQGPAKITIPAVVTGGQIQVNITPATTVGYAPGNYRYQLYASQGSDKHVVEVGQVEVEADFSTLDPNHDFRTHDEKMLDAIKQVLEGRITKDLESYEIEGRQVTRIPILELQKLKNQYQARVIRARRKQQGKASFSPRTVKTRFKT